jgi:ABC-type Fe3+/spermidine/putrescine transport system ATPase subunit
VQLAVRPEELSLAADGSATGGASGGASPAVIPGVVQKSTFTGSLVTYTVSCGEGVTLAVERHRPAPSDILSAGARVKVIVPAEAILAFDPKTGERV